MNNLREIAQKFNIEGEFGVFESIEMSRRFSFKVGGKTPLLIEPLTENALLKALNILEAEKIPYFILGGGTNIVFSDKGFDGVVISTVKLNKIELIEEKLSANFFNKPQKLGQEENSFIQSESKVSRYIIKCQCGVLMNTLVNFAVKNNFSRLEEFCGLPGTCGGAGYMNARCFNKEISDVVGKIVYFDKVSDAEKAGVVTFEKKILDFDKKLWAYKKSPFTNTSRVIANVEFIVQKTDDSKLSDKAAGFMRERVEKGHFKFPCAGSVFKNNHDFGKPTGQIIDELGLKGYSIGGAQIAPWHGNIIINQNNASSEDIKALVDFIKKQVKEKCGFQLEEEIIFKG